ncbi:hypothetical protein FA15DRAFT_700081 [Coprinopsis marcescibilis]|uniref:Uncharacterized protein n=1 Tax=Coprinopsis marcescibilis TaxID=230819 RepID=A0A5C3L9Y7_COPMA|nr:hypothetical protein FA15DRAFT_700081 [Coprinopsis marcescibilis]
MSERHHQHQQSQSERNQVIPDVLNGEADSRERGSISEDSGRADSNVFHNDEAFERYQMGQGNKSSWQGSKPSVKFNHHARGGAKEKAENPTKESLAEELDFSGASF